MVPVLYELKNQLYDFMVTFDEEFSFIRESNWSLIKMVYVLARYLPFIDVVTAIYSKTHLRQQYLLKFTNFVIQQLIPHPM